MVCNRVLPVRGDSPHTADDSTTVKTISVSKVLNNGDFWTDFFKGGILDLLLVLCDVESYCFEIWYTRCLCNNNLPYCL